MARQIRSIIGEDGQVVELRPGQPRKRQEPDGQEPEPQTEGAAEAAPADAAPKRGRGRPPKPKGNGPSPADKKNALAEYTLLKTESARISQQIAAMLARFEALGGTPTTTTARRREP